MSLILITMPDQSHLLQSSIWAINSVYSYLATIIGRIVSSAYHFKHTHSRTPEPLPPCWVVQLGARVWCFAEYLPLFAPIIIYSFCKKRNPTLSWSWPRKLSAPKTHRTVLDSFQTLSISDACQKRTLIEYLAPEASLTPGLIYSNQKPVEPRNERFNLPRRRGPRSKSLRHVAIPLLRNHIRAKYLTPYSFRFGVPWGDSGSVELRWSWFNWCQITPKSLKTKRHMRRYTLLLKKS